MIRPTRYPMSPDDLSDLFGEAVSQGRNGKQETLISGDNIKTINGESILGSGDIIIQGGGGSSNPTTLASITGLNLTGNTNQISASYRIAGGTLVADNSIYIRNLLTKSAGSTTSTGRIYINTTNSLTGATLLATASQAMNSSNYFQRFERNFLFDGTHLNCYNPTNAISTDLTVGTLTKVAFNPAIDYFLIFAVQNSSTTPDNLGHKRVIVQLYE